MRINVLKKLAVIVMLILTTFCFGQGARGRPIHPQMLHGTWEGNIDGVEVVYIFHHPVSNGTYERIWGNHRTEPYKWEIITTVNAARTVTTNNLILEYFDEEYEEMGRMDFLIDISSDARRMTINNHGESGSAVFRKR